MVLPSEGKLKAKISPGIQDADQVHGLGNLKSSLIEAYKEVRLNNRTAQQKNKADYNKKPKERTFEVNDKVYFFCPVREPGRGPKFRSFWQGPFVIVQRSSDLNCKIIDKKGKEYAVHINRLKKSCDQIPRNFENTRRSRHKIKTRYRDP